MSYTYTTKNHNKQQRPVKSAKTNLPKNQNIVRAPSAIARKSTIRAPKIKYLPNGETVISHREYLVDLTSNKTNVFPVLGPSQLVERINPLNGGLFPWLSLIARNYETYNFKKLEVQYEPQCGSGTGGVVMLTIDYDPSDAAAESKTQLMANFGSVKDSPWVCFSHVSKKENLSKQKSYYCAYALSAQNDPSTLRQNDVGTLQVVAIGQGSGDPTIIGELYVDYIIHLKTPQLGESLGGLSMAFDINSPSSDLRLYNRYGNLNFVATGSDTITLKQAFCGFVFFKVAGSGITNGVGITSTTGGVTYGDIASSTVGGLAYNSYWLRGPPDGTIKVDMVSGATTTDSMNITFTMADLMTLPLSNI
jgi:hypothetical protein